VSYEVRRVVTGHTADGKSTVLFDSAISLVEHDDASDPLARHGSVSEVLWTTKGFPADNTGLSDAGKAVVPTALADGTVLRITRYTPGAAPRHHRTDSIDYAVVISGSIQVELETETVTLQAGDVIIQRGTIHNWICPGPDPCVMLYALIDAKPVTVEGVTLPAQG
jgi:quercetin dioxygenase-like cupin family protein